MIENFQLKVNTNVKRLDICLAQELPQISRARLQKLIKEGKVLLNGKPAKTSQQVFAGDEIKVFIEEIKETNILAEDIPLDIIYEDKDIIVVNKPRGMVVHPAAGNYQGTLVNALLNHCKDLSGINGEMRPGIVHRLDKDTSGLLVAAKNDAAHKGLVKAWPTGQVQRFYKALLHGEIAEPGGKIEAAIGRHPVNRKKMAVDPKNGKEAITDYVVLERFAGYTYVELKLHTGRTHQIRVHMAYLGHPVVGDVTYGFKKKALGAPSQLLHCGHFIFPHPITQKTLDLTAAVPDYFAQILKELKSKR